MKTTPLITGVTACAAAVLVFGNSNVQAQNLLSDPNFSSDTPVPSGVGGWHTFGDAEFSTTDVMAGDTFSMLDSGPGGFTVPGCNQFLPSSAGLEYSLTGYGFTSSALTGASAGFLQVAFFSGANGTGSNLGTVETSPGNALASNEITSSSPTDTWIPLDIATVEAPAGTASMAVYTLVLDANATSVSFDSLV
jgi:hypothetical protein